MEAGVHYFCSVARTSELRHLHSVDMLMNGFVVAVKQVFSGDGSQNAALRISFICIDLGALPL